MFFLNLSAAEFFTLLGVLGGFTAALYLLDRTKRSRVVSTLRFWTPGMAAEQHHNRKRVREPWSLALQLLGLIMLLLAIAQVKLGSPGRQGRDHVLLLDTSAWTAQQSGASSLLDREKQFAGSYVAALPARDRAMIVRADALVTPATGFTGDHNQLFTAIRDSKPGYSALNFAQALAFAQQARRWGPGERGEIVYIGPGMNDDQTNSANQATAPPRMENLRTILVRPDRQHIGIRSLGVRRSDTGENAWLASLLVKNYGLRPAVARLNVRCAGTSFAPRAILLQPGEEKPVEYEFVTHPGAEFTAALASGDALATDQRVAIQLPRADTLRIAVATSRPQVLQPLFAGNDRLQVRFFESFSREAENWADLVVFDRSAGATKHPSIWIDPPKDGSPLPVKASIADAAMTNWNPDTALSVGLHAKERHIQNAEVFQTFDGDLSVLNAAEGPMVVARNAGAQHAKLAVIGFDPFQSELRFKVTTPLLFANLLRWVSPDVFRPVETSAERIGAVTVALDPDERPDAIRVLNDQNAPEPFFARKDSLQIFAQRPEILRVQSPSRERVLSITLPDVAANEWKPPSNALSGVPRWPSYGASAIDLWKWLALAAAVILFIEWMLFGRRRAAIRRIKPVAHAAVADERERELVSR